MLYSAFLIGIVGSVHCLGMCGPIALALPIHRGTGWQRIQGRLLYNGGRIMTYALLGLVMGSLGWGISFSTSQQSLSIAAGILLLVVWLLPSKVSTRFSLVAPVSRFSSRVRGQFSALLKTRSRQALLLLGLLNGLLPCGMVYVALAGATVTGNAFQGMAYMALFGLGTLPMMLATSLASQWLSLSKKAKLVKLAPVFTLVLAGLLILRGLNLGIAGVSPRIQADATGAANTVKVDCCHKH